MDYDTIRLDKFPQCGIGNKIMYYYYMRSEAIRTNKKYSCVSDPHLDLLFDNYCGKLSDTTKYCTMTLGTGRFFNDIFPMDSILQMRHIAPLYHNKTAIIHFRGSDYKYWKNGEGILPTSYYMSCIDILIEENIEDVIINTDDHTMISLLEVVKKLKSTGMNVIYDAEDNKNSTESFIKDFLSFSNADIIISAPSTYAITASMFGRRKKKIIHSKYWLDIRLKENSTYWNDLLDGSRADYNIWKLV